MPAIENVTVSRADRLAMRIIQLGALAVVFASSALVTFDLDRFFVPKELILHLTALLAGLLTLRRLTGSHKFLMAFLLLSAISAAFATNRWAGLRALAISASSVILFWASRALRDAGLGPKLLNAVALAVVMASIVALLQAYGMRSDLFASTRAPGGTLGNRNFVGHAVAFGLPVVLLGAMRSRSKKHLVAVAIVAAALVLTRSRAAWLAAAAVLIIFIGCVLVRRLWKRSFVVIACAAVGAAAALLIPNTLHWRSENPYLDSVRGVTGYEAGSGRGRLIQYERSLLLALRHPLFGVGPGNWPVEYPKRVPADDPSLDTTAVGMTSNPWPSSDWIAFIAERGFAAAILLGLFFISIASGAFTRFRAAIDPDEALDATTLLAMAVAACLVGAFDAVLLLPLPALLIWTALGALSMSSDARPSKIVVALVILVCAAGAVRSVAQLVAMNTYATHSDRASLENAARIDPGNYRLQLRLAQMGRRNQRCPHARAAHALFPAAGAARGLARGCGP